MDFWTVMLVTLAIGALLVVGGGLVTYMASLVKNAYALRVELQSQMEEGMRRLEDDIEKRTRWIKRDVIEEVDKIRNAINMENNRKLVELTENLNKKLIEMDAAYRADRLEMVRQIETQRQMIVSMDQKLRALKREQRRADMGLVLESPLAGADVSRADVAAEMEMGGEGESGNMDDGVPAPAA